LRTLLALLGRSAAYAADTDTTSSGSSSASIEVGDGDGLPVACDRGQTWIDFNQTSSSRTVTHDRYVSVPNGGSVDVTRNVTKIGTITASVSFTSSTEAKASVVMGEFSESVGVTLAASGSATLQTSETGKLPHGPRPLRGFPRREEVHRGMARWSVQHQRHPRGSHQRSGGVLGHPGRRRRYCSKTHDSSSFEYEAKAYAC
jgi:hypothetical protein